MYDPRTPNGFDQPLIDVSVASGLRTLFHSPLARGGMIGARPFCPLACGVVMVISALILGM